MLMQQIQLNYHKKIQNVAKSKTALTTIQKQTIKFGITKFAQQRKKTKELRFSSGTSSVEPSPSD
jgi:hypothetical protein